MTQSKSIVCGQQWTSERDDKDTRLQRGRWIPIPCIDLRYFASNCVITDPDTPVAVCCLYNICFVCLVLWPYASWSTSHCSTFWCNIHSWSLSDVFTFSRRLLINNSPHCACVEIRLCGEIFLLLGYVSGSGKSNSICFRLTSTRPTGYECSTQQPCQGTKLRQSDDFSDPWTVWRQSNERGIGRTHCPPFSMQGKSNTTYTTVLSLCCAGFGEKQFIHYQPINWRPLWIL